MTTGSMASTSNHVSAQPTLQNWPQYGHQQGTLTSRSLASTSNHVSAQPTFQNWPQHGHQQGTMTTGSMASTSNHVSAQQTIQNWPQYGHQQGALTSRSLASTSNHVSAQPTLQNWPQHGDQGGAFASTSNHVSAHFGSQKMKITLRYQGEGTKVNAPPGKGAQCSSISLRAPKSYHQHNLMLTKGKISSYKCSGCEEIGIGDRYICNDCSYILHPDCMYYKEKATHKFLDGSTFKFHQARFDSTYRYCDACGSDIGGFFYHCEKTSKDLHPCCLNLKETVRIGEMKFQLRRKLTSECFYCSSRKKDYKDDCWIYSLERQDLQAHVSCMKAALLECLKGERNNNMSTMVVVKHGKQITEGLKWAQRLLKVAVCVLSGNPFPLLEVALELF